MAELIPSLNTCLPKMTAGEKRVARRFLELLEDDYLVWYDIPLGKQRRYPDFIMLQPERGLLFIEAKDWKLENVKDVSSVGVELLTDTGLKNVPNPLEQSRQFAYQVINQLLRDPQLRTRGGRHAEKLAFAHGFGVVLP